MDQEAERKAFEFWAHAEAQVSQERLREVLPEGQLTYKDSLLQGMWWAWQARAMFDQLRNDFPEIDGQEHAPRIVASLGDTCFADSEGYQVSGTEIPAPCPFCSAGPDHICVDTEGAAIPEYWVRCDVCSCNGPSATTQIEAARAWNVRCQLTAPE